jgi:hypothetical protein
VYETFIAKASLRCSSTVPVATSTTNWIGAGLWAGGASSTSQQGRPKKSISLIGRSVGRVKSEPVHSLAERVRIKTSPGPTYKTRPRGARMHSPLLNCQAVVPSVRKLVRH